MLKRNPFIAPASPVSRTAPPSGDGWIHEVKFDGFRVQLHKDVDDVTIFSRNGHDITRRYPDIRDALFNLPCSKAILDAELTACDSQGKPDFISLMRREDVEMCVWAFDALRIDEIDLRTKPLWQRKSELQRIILEADDHTLRFSDDFDDPAKLLQVAEKWGLEGIVSKKIDQPYRSGRNVGWIKVKTQSWRQANTSRWELFQK
jgi:bifunctional non-homologous end joining protein LigD